MAINVNSYAIKGIEYMFYAARIAGIPQGTSGSALANGGDAGMGRLGGVTGLDVSEPDAPTLPILGNNGVVGQFMGQPQALPSGTYTMTVFDQVFHTLSIGLAVEASGDYDMVGGFPQCFQFADLCFVINSPAQSQEAGSVGVSGWAVYEILMANAQSKLFSPWATNAVKEFNGAINVTLSDETLYGVALTNADWGSTKLAGIGYWSPYPVTYHTFIGDNSDVAVTLSETPVAANVTAVQAWQAGVQLTYGAGAGNYTVNPSTKVVTFGTAPGAGVEVVIKYQFVAAC
jgi:hypothetical protein